MPQSLVQIYLHIVYSTKNRERYLSDAATRGETHRYLGGICEQLECPALVVGGTADHVHVLCRQSKGVTVIDLLRELKRGSSVWIKERFGDQSAFHWQAGYGAFSISPSHVGSLTQYIRNQEKHHQKVSFQDEFRRLCRKFGVEIDERYVWD